MTRGSSIAADRGNHHVGVENEPHVAPVVGYRMRYCNLVCHTGLAGAPSTSLLERGLELDPDNQLFRQNLRRLEQESAARR